MAFPLFPDLEPHIPSRVRSFVRAFMAFAGPRRVASLLALMMLGALVEGLSLALLVPLLALITGAGGGRLQAWTDAAFASIGADDPLSRIILIALAFIAMMTLRAWVLLARDRATTAVEAAFVEHIRVGLLRAVASARWQDVAQLQYARVSSALSSEITNVAVAAQAIMRIAVAAALLTAQLALTVMIAWSVGLLAIMLLAAAAFVSSGRLRIASDFGAKLRDGSVELAHTAGQMLAGLKQANAENRQSVFVADFEVSAAALVAAQVEYRRRVTRYNFTVAVAIAVAAGATVIAGVWAQTGSAALIAAILILSRMAGPAVGLQRDLTLFASSLPSQQMIEELQQELAQGIARSSSEPPPTGSIVFDRVSHRHARDGSGVEAISFTITPGEVVGLNGPSGAGKTTLVDLMIGLLAPQAGTITIGGTILDDAVAYRWRERVAYAAQDAFLSNDTIRRNLVQDGVGEAAIWEALELAHIADTVRAMPAGLDTVLAERGSRLSGGERQRIGLARAILRRPALLILDEATNAIDVATEKRILERLIRLDPAMTIVIVAHRRETLAHCSRILTLDRGRLIGDDKGLANS